MKKFIVFLSSVFEFVFYTFLMVLISLIPINNQALKLLVHFLGLILVAFLFYFLIRFIFNKLDMRAKKYIYYVAVVNLILGLIAPIFLILIIPSEVLTNFAFLVLVSSVYYGILINVLLCFFNYFLTNRYKKA